MVTKKTQKKGFLTIHLIRAVTGLIVLILLVVAAGFLAHHLILRKQPRPPLVKTPIFKETPTFEIYPKEKKDYHKPVAKPKITLPQELPKVAIIIDDIGYDRIMAEKFLDLDAVLTFSVLPYSPFQDKIISKAQAKGFTIMLHLPMEPMEYPGVDPGPGGLFTIMSPDQLISQLNKDLNAVPSIQGVNNHMGSKMTAVSSQMNQIFSILKKRGLFFIDSRTTDKSMGNQSARLLQVPFAQRDVFLDNIQEPEFIRRQIQLLVRIAKRDGEAVGIAHPHQATYEALREALPDLRKKVQLVPASRVVHIIN